MQLDRKKEFLRLINESNKQLTIKEITEKTGIPRTTILRYCNEFNYEPLKSKNPWNKGLSKESNDSLKRMSEKMAGKKKSPRSDKEKQKISNAIKDKHKNGMLNEYGGRGEKHIYREIILNSDSALGIAKMLDSDDIEWEQPVNSFMYIDSFGENRYAYMDFYLPEYDIYLAVKTNITSTVRKKLMNIKKNHNIKLLIVDEMVYRRALYTGIKKILEKF